ncbi:hypothetical protein D3C84_1122330 [compost metagenome]
MQHLEFLNEDINSGLHFIQSKFIGHHEACDVVLKLFQVIHRKLIADHIHTESHPLVMVIFKIRMYMFHLRSRLYFSINTVIRPQRTAGLFILPFLASLNHGEHPKQMLRAK